MTDRDKQPAWKIRGPSRRKAAAIAGLPASGGSGKPADILARANRTRRRPASRKLKELAAEIGATAPADAEVKGIALDSRQVKPGDLFVAVPGRHSDGRDFAEDARARGAVAVVAQEPVPVAPTVVVDDPRAAAAHLAAALYDHPAERVRLIGVSGTLGKTSTTFLLRDILAAAGEELGLIGSLGIRYGDTVLDTGMTTPDAPVLQEALSAMAQVGVRAAAMEVTSHALVQNRLEGLTLRIGLLTNLVPDEHLEFHPTPEDYLRAKLRYLDMFEPGAPLIVNADDALVRAHTRSLDRPVVRVSAFRRHDAAVHVEDLSADARGSHFRLDVLRPIPRLAGGDVGPFAIPVTLPILGVQQVMNFALAATLALMVGVRPQAVLEGALRSRPIRRRMEIVSTNGPMILDDTVGHPRSLRAVLDTVALMKRRGRTHLVFGLRGMRGPAINRSLGEALAEVAAASKASVVVTASEDAADERNRVQAEERIAFFEGLSRARMPSFCYEPDLERAVARALDGAAAEDLVLLLGAQGMDAAAQMARARLSARGS
jgi:UDP-N-acetylmuramoyl-L-alanyl-D-glutamate--2,6-diaminopimelate ligase